MRYYKQKKWKEIKEIPSENQHHSHSGWLIVSDASRPQQAEAINTKRRQVLSAFLF